MRKVIAFSALLIVAMHSALVSAVDPTSCYWCVSIGKTWNNKNNTCAPTGNPITTARECTSILEFTGLDKVLDIAYGVSKFYNGTL